MTDAVTDQGAQAPARKGKGLVLALVLAILGGGGSFYALYSGLVLAPHGAETHEATPEDAVEPLPEVSSVPVDRIVLPIGAGDAGRYLHFAAQIETPKTYEGEVVHLLPRVSDVLNTYLRAVEPSDLSERTALVRLRAQMLRRVQIVLGEGRVRDLLITEFVIN